MSLRLRCNLHVAHDIERSRYYPGYCKAKVPMTELVACLLGLLRLYEFCRSFEKARRLAT